MAYEWNVQKGNQVRVKIGRENFLAEVLRPIHSKIHLGRIRRTTLPSRIRKERK